MKKRNKHIYDALRPYFRRLRKESLIKSIIISICIGAAVGLMVLALSYVLPIKIFFWHGVVAFCISAAISTLLIYNFIKPTIDNVATRVDELGLNEKVQTMLQFEDEDNAFANIQREDAIRSLIGLPPKQLRLNFSKRLLALCIALMVAFSLIGFLPNSHRQELIEKEQQILKEIEKLEELLEKLEEEIEESNLPSELKEEAQEIVEELKETLKKEDKLSKKLSAINEAKEKLEEIAKKAKQEELNNVSDALKQEEGTEGLGEAIESGDAEKVKEELKEILEDIRNTDESELKEKLADLSDSIENASKEATGDLKEALEELAEKLKEASKSKDISDLGESFEEFQKDLENVMDGEDLEIDDIEQLLEDMKKVQSDDQGEGNQGDGDGDGEGNGQGQGSDEGEGEGEGEGNPNDGDGKGKGQGSGAGKGDGKEVKEDVSIYDPYLMGGDGDDVYVPGKKGEDGNVEKIELGEAELKEGTVPYDEVYRDYTERARQAMDRESVPEDIRSLIEKYFSSLE